MNVVDEGHRSPSRARAAPWRGGGGLSRSDDKTTPIPHASPKVPTVAHVTCDVMEALLILCRPLLVVEGQVSAVDDDASPRLLFNTLTRLTNGAPHRTAESPRDAV